MSRLRLMELVNGIIMCIDLLLNRPIDLLATALFQTFRDNTQCYGKVSGCVTDFIIFCKR